MAARPSIHSYLVYRIPGQPDQVVIWDVVAITVGRLPTQDIVVPDREVSREHAVLRKEGEVFSVEDLGTTLGTTVNGEPIKRHELCPGDVIRIGPLAMKFGQRPEPIRPGAGIHFASELKGFPAPGAEGGDRTVLGVSLEESTAGLAIPVAAPAARVKSLGMDGSLEVGEGESEPLAGLGPDDVDLVSEDDLHQILATSVKVRDLDAELPRAEPPGPPDPASSAPPQPSPDAIEEAGRETVPNLPPVPSAPAPAPPTGVLAAGPDATEVYEAVDAPPPARATARLSVELEGPAADVAVLVEALEGRELGVGPVRLLLRRG